jgi:predicted AlkP superfamily pyrophosphatase or phosphodiesterase
MRNTFAILLLCINSTFQVFAQSAINSSVSTSQQSHLTQPSQPTLIIGIVVDQMRYDYLYRYQKNYSKNGLNRLLNEGFSCENTNFNFVPTYTGPGHAAIYTGTTPAVNGIVGNDWYDRSWGTRRYVTADDKVKTVGSDSKAGQHSPRVLLSSTITDELRLSNNFESKVVGVCLKDRGSILPAGHIPNACYWFDDETGNWITSTYYSDSLGLPKWVNAFNNAKYPDKYLSQDWKTLHPEKDYTESFKDWEIYEKRLKGNETGKFPYNLPAMKEGNNYGVIRNTPFGNSLTLDFALEAIDKMKLGEDAAPDFLALSFSSTDYCAHHFGIHALETQDTYLRLDADIERLFTHLDKKFGQGKVLIFLTADHGGAETPEHLKAIRIPAGVFEESKMDLLLNKAIETATNTRGGYIFEVINQQVYYNNFALQAAKISLETANDIVIETLQSLEGVNGAFSRKDLLALPADYPFASLIRLGYHPRRSGDVFYLLDPAWIPDDIYFKKTGTTHGSSYPYDTHVPLLWHGWGIKPGKSNAPVSITDIAPTLSALLHIMEPNGATGKVILDVMK